MKRYVKIILAILLLIIILMSVLFELRDVPKVKDNNSYSIESKDLGGLQLFYGMLQEFYGAEKVTHYKEDDFSYLQERSGSSLLVVIDKTIVLDSILQNVLSEYAARGYEVLLIADEYQVEDYRSLSTELGLYAHDTIFDLVWKDTDTLVYKPALSESSMIPYSSIHHFRKDSSGRFEPLLTRGDDYVLFQVGKIADYQVYLHSAPMLFQNRSALSGAFLQNFLMTFRLFENDNVIVHQFDNAFLRVGSNKDSVLQYILGQPSLKYAYYLTLLSGLVYVLFSSKRKQKVIPIEELSKNTSLDYVETASSIFMAQNQNNKLVKHMRRNFYFKIKSMYFLNQDDPLLEEKLARKSKYPKEEISKIIKQFDLAGTHSFNDDQLMRLYNDINSFDKNRK